MRPPQLRDQSRDAARDRLRISFIDLEFEDGFRLDLEALAAAIAPKTRIVSVTCPHNPTGVMMAEAELRALVALAVARGCLLLVDETYRDLSYEGALPLAASLGDHVISVSSLSKAYGVPGIRIGWLINRDPAPAGTVPGRQGADQHLRQRRRRMDRRAGAGPARRAASADAGRDAPPACARRRMDRGRGQLEWVPPAGGVVCFPRMRDEPPGGTAAFYRRLLAEHGTYVGPGHWFEMPDRNFRLGYGWSTGDQLEAGLAAISRALRK